MLIPKSTLSIFFCKYPAIVVSSEVEPTPNIVEPPTVNILYVLSGFSLDISEPRKPCELIFNVSLYWFGLTTIIPEKVSYDIVLRSWQIVLIVK